MTAARRRPLKLLVTGSAGFIGGYLVQELLRRGHSVVGVDNFEKYGRVTHSYDAERRYRFVKGDARDARLLTRLAKECDQVVALAAKIGGIAYFHEFAYDLLANNERIMSATFDAAIEGFRHGRVKKINVISSSMVFENADRFPSREGDQLRCPPPFSTYGFQKLACEYYAKGAWEQYKLPYTIIRPFNCVGIGERRPLAVRTVWSGNIKLALSHVVPDLVVKAVKKQNPLHLLGRGNQVRHYTYGGDLAAGIADCIENPKAVNEDFNLSSPRSTTVKELARLIWRKVNGDAPLRFKYDPSFPHDVQKRVPDVRKAKRLLGYEATTSLDAMLDEVIPWVTLQMKEGGI